MRATAIKKGAIADKNSFYLLNKNSFFYILKGMYELSMGVEGVKPHWNSCARQKGVGMGKGNKYQDNS